MNFLEVVKHLLPKAAAWNITVNKQLRQFFDGLSQTGDAIKIFIDLVWLDIFPDTTRQIDEWENQFGLTNPGLTEQERRDRLTATWRAQGGQDPRYIQDTLQANGFDVYLHKWWVPGTELDPGVVGCVVPRDPNDFLKQTTDAELVYLAEMGEATAQAGEANATAGDTLAALGYVLVNPLSVAQITYTIEAGEALAEMGEAASIAGDIAGGYQNPQPVVYAIPLDPAKWPFFLYIGASVFPELAQVDPKRREEFEALCLKICPTQQWLGILVEYV